MYYKSIELIYSSGLQCCPLDIWWACFARNLVPTDIHIIVAFVAFVASVESEAYFVCYSIAH